MFNIQGRFSGFSINALNRFEDSQTFFLDENYLLFDHEYYYDWIQKWVAVTIYLLNANTSFVISGARFFFSLKISVASTSMLHFVCSIFLYATVLSRMLDNLAGYLTELCASDFYWIVFSFHFLLYSSFVINFMRFFKGILGRWKSSYSDIPREIWLYKLNLMREKLSYQIINISAVNQAVFCYY